MHKTLRYWLELGFAVALLCLSAGVTMFAIYFAGRR